MSTGFHCWNVFEKEHRRLKQLYDYTIHIYDKENSRLENLVEKGKRRETLFTGITNTKHEILSLYHATDRFYPNKLRDLLLVSLVTILEAYLVDLVKEIFQREISPFLKNHDVDIKLSRLLTYASIDAIQEEQIEKETRNLSNKGIEETRSYFKKRFNIKFGSLGINLSKLFEMHERRHLIIHRNGVTDEQYIHNYPSYGYSVGEKIDIDHNYILKALPLFKDFALALRNEAMRLYPGFNRKKKVIKGDAAITEKSSETRLLIRGEFSNNVSQTVQAIKSVTTKSDDEDLTEYIVQLIIEEKRCILIISGDFEEISRYMAPLKRVDGFEVRSVSKVHL